MRTISFGRTGLQISPFVLGTLNFGRVLTPRESMRLLDQAVEAGINFIDTANEYSNGLSERIIGDWLKKNPHKRDKVVIASKVYEHVGDTPNDGGLSAYHIKRACRDSLRRLQTDHIDLYQMHHIDRETSWQEAWQAMDHLVNRGDITYVGSSNFAAWHIARMQSHADARGKLGIVSEQSIYNLLNRMVELELLPACKEMGIAFLAYSPLQDGLLANGLKKVNQQAQQHTADKDVRLVELLEKGGLVDRMLELHPLTQYDQGHVQPRLQAMQRAIVSKTDVELPDKNRADYTMEVINMIVNDAPNLSQQEKIFILDYAVSRELGTLSRSTFWRSMLKANQYKSQLERYEALCKAYNYQPATIALNWLTQQPHVTAVVIGPRTSYHLESSISSLTMKPDSEFLVKLNDIFPPIGQAPEAYAW